MKQFSPDPNEVKAFQDAVDHRLSGLRADPYLARRVMNGERKEIKMKKRISLGLVTACALLLMTAVVLAESRNGVSGFFSSSHPDQAAENSLKAESPWQELKEETRILSLPVEIHEKDEWGQEKVLHLSCPAYQVTYGFTVRQEEGKTAVESVPAFPRVSAITDQTILTESPFSRFLFVSSEIQAVPDPALHAGDGDQIWIEQMGGGYTVLYNAVLSLNQYGQIIDRKQSAVSDRFDYAGAFSVRQEGRVPSAGEDEDVFPQGSIHLPGQTWGDMGHGSMICFGGPVVIHSLDEQGEESDCIIREDGDNLRATLHREALEASVQFQAVPIDGDFHTVEMDQAWLTLGSHTTDADARFGTVESPAAEILRRQDGYVIRFTGGLFRVSYADEIWLSPQAISQEGLGVSSDPEYWIRAHYAYQELPYDFTFEIEASPEMRDIQQFGSDMAGVSHVAQEDGTWLNVTLPKGSASEFFEAAFEAELFQASDAFTGKDGPVEWREEWLSLRDMRNNGVTTFETVEKPACYVAYYPGSYTVRVTGGALRIRYISDFWCTPATDESPAQERHDVAQKDIPFDFCFNCPMPANE